MALRQKLPEYMIPSAVVVLKALPLTPNGKLDRKALPQPEPTSGNNNGYLAPRNKIEQTLARIWSEVLHVDRIGIHDNFFELGGHSLLATRVAAHVQQLLEWRMPVATLFQSPVLESLARVIADHKGKARRVALVPIQPSGTRKPLYFVHGWGGEVGGFMEDLARLFGTDQPMYGLQALRDAQGGYLHQSVEELAAHYVKEIQAFQPQGPYHLAGHSIGGWIAFEVAQQLRSKGLTVGVVALLDTRLNCQVPSWLYLQGLGAYLRTRLGTHWRCFRALKSGARRDYFLARATILKRLVLRNHGQRVPLTKTGRQASEVPSAAVEDFVDVLVRAYRPRRYAGAVHYFGIDEHTVARAVAVWLRLANGGVTVHQVGGEHISMVDKAHLPHLAAGMQSVLQAAQSVRND